MQATKLRKGYAVKIIEAMQSPDIVQLKQLARVKGIGIKTLENFFDVARGSVSTELIEDVQQSLFE